MLSCIAPWKQIEVQTSYKNIKYFNIAGPRSVYRRSILFLDI